VYPTEVIALREKIENLMNNLTEEQREVFNRNILLWEKTAEVKNPHPKGAALKNPPIGGTRPCPQRGRAV